MINWLEDVGAPAIVAGTNIVLRTNATQVLGMSLAEAAPYVYAIGGYVAAFTGFGGRYNGLLKNIGIAAAPLMFEKLYDRVKGVASRPSGVSMRRIARYPGPANETPFQGVRLS